MKNEFEDFGFILEPQLNIETNEIELVLICLHKKTDMNCAQVLQSFNHHRLPKAYILEIMRFQMEVINRKIKKDEKIPGELK